MLIQLINWLPSKLGGIRSLEMRPRESQQFSYSSHVGATGSLENPSKCGLYKYKTSKHPHPCGLVSNLTPLDPRVQQQQGPLIRELPGGKHI